MRSLSTLLLLISLILVLATAWGGRHLNEDIYPALCAGRDAVEGRLAEPDQWAFTTHGKVWVNQAWLSGLVYYVSYLSLNEWGPMLVKGALLIACFPLLFFRCRLLGASALVSLLSLILGAVAIALRLSIRPENFGILWSILLSVFLVMPRSLGLWRQAGTLVVMLIWSNTHGSLVLGFIFIGIKMMSGIVEYAVSDTSDELPKTAEKNRGFDKVSIRKETASWAVTLALAVAAAALVSPYGVDNLVMPFRQLGSEYFLKWNPHWRPLLAWEFPPRVVSDASWPYLSVLFLSALLMVWSAYRGRVYGRASLARGIFSAGRSGDPATEFGCAAVLAVAAFAHARFILFAAPALVPSLAFLLQHLADAFGSRTGNDAVGLRNRLSTFFSFCLLSATLWIFTVDTLIPYLPGNPAWPDCPLAVRITGHFPMYLANVTEFMKRNKIKGRIFSNWVLSDFLLLRVPDIQVFIGCRAQSIYGEKTYRDYRTVAHLDRRNRAQKAQALSLLDRYGVSGVVIEAKPALMNLTELLCKSRRWDIVYAGPHALVFLRNEAPIRRISDVANKLENLWYPNETIRVLSHAYLEFYAAGRVTHQTETELKVRALKTPLAILYNALYLSGSDGRGCVDDETRRYLLGELKRLSGMSFMRADGANTILDSMIQILGILDLDWKICPNSRGNPYYAQMEAALNARAARIRREFLPFGYTPWQRVWAQ